MAKKLNALAFVGLASLWPAMGFSEEATANAQVVTSDAVSQMTPQQMDEAYAELSKRFQMAISGQNQELMAPLAALAERGHVGAQTLVGLAYLYGWGVERDLPKAAPLLKNSALQGDALAQSEYAACLLFGQGVEKDVAEGERLMLQARAGLMERAQAGEAFAQQNVGMTYRWGFGGKPDNEQAVYWFKKAAAQGLMDGQLSLASALYSGVGIPQDRVEGFKWYVRAAEQGSSLAMYIVGFAYEYGQGVKKDLAQAFEWYRKAAARKMIWAQYALGRFYSEGKVVPQDLKHAFELYQLAAEKGCRDAQLALLSCYLNGEGVEKDAEKAQYWAERGTEQLENPLSDPTPYIELDEGF